MKYSQSTGKLRKASLRLQVLHRLEENWDLVLTSEMVKFHSKESKAFLVL